MIKYFQKSCFLLAVLLLLSVMTSCAKLNHKVVVKKRIPDFDVVQMSGTHTNLASLSGGQVTLVVFWATWCSRCREEIPHLNELTTYYDSALTVIAVSVGEPLQTVKAHVSGLGIRYLVVVTQLSNFTNLGIDSIPKLLLLDAKGRIQQIENSVNKSLQGSIRQLVAENNSLEN